MTEHPTTPPPGPLPSILPDSERPPEPDTDRFTAAFDAMRCEFERMARAYEDVISLLTKRPAWADDIMEAVGKIESSRVIQAKVEALEAVIVELKQWQSDHADGCGSPDCPRRKVV